MIKVSIQDVTPGMEVARDVNGQNGRLLVPRGLTLAEEHIRAMRAFGVQTVDIVSDGPEPDTEAETQAAYEAACLKRLRPRFTDLDLDGPFGDTLWRLTASRCAARLRAEGSALDVLQEKSALLCLPPEQHLFTQQHADPAELVSGDVELATLPEVYARLLQALGAPNSSPTSIAAVVKHDASLTAKLLKLVNSPVYGVPTHVDSISRAVAMVGQKELSTLVMGLAACQAFPDIPPELCDMRAFWRHAAACGVYASGLAEACPGTAPDRVFVGGLLHDLGQLVILRRIPAAAGRAMLLSRIEGLPLSEAETAVLGFDHALVGQALLANWNFPVSLREMVANHHQPSGRPEDRETAIIHVADILAMALAWPAWTGPLVPPLHETAWRSLGLSESLLRDVVAAGDDRIRDIEDVFFSENRHPTN